MYTREERKGIQGKRGSIYKGREEVYTREERKYQGKRGSVYKGNYEAGNQESPLRKEKLIDIKYQTVQYASQVGEEGIKESY